MNNDIHENGPPSPAERLFSASVATDLGPRDIGFFWGDVASVVQPDSVVVISTNCFQPKITGMAWRSLTDGFPQLAGREKDFREVIVSGLNSLLWPMSETSLEQVEKYKDDPRFKMPAILASPKDLKGFERIFVARTLPADKTDLEKDYQQMVKTCFPAIKAVESEELTSGSNVSSSYNHVVITALGGRQRYEPEIMFKALYQAARSWLCASPSWRTVDVVCWNEGQNQEEARKSVLGSLGEVPISVTDKSLKYLFKEVRAVLDDVIKSFDPSQGYNRAKIDSPLRKDLKEDLKVVLDRGIKGSTVREIGRSAGALAEGLVQWLTREFFGKGKALANDFHAGIEAIGVKEDEAEGHASAWFKSYLHTLRVLRNKSAHSSEAETDALPQSITDEDLTVLLANLKQVLRFHKMWMDQNPRPGKGKNS